MLRKQGKKSCLIPPPPAKVFVMWHIRHIAQLSITERWPESSNNPMNLRHMWDCDTSGKTSEGSMFRRIAEMFGKLVGSVLGLLWYSERLHRSAPPQRPYHTAFNSMLWFSKHHLPYFFNTPSALRCGQAPKKAIKIHTFTFEVVSMLVFRFVLIFLAEKLKENPALSRIFNKVLSENEDKDSATMFKLPNICMWQHFSQNCKLAVISSKCLTPADKRGIWIF